MLNLTVRAHTRHNLLRTYELHVPKVQKSIMFPFVTHSKKCFIENLVEKIYIEQVNTKCIYVGNSVKDNVHSKNQISNIVTLFLSI